MLNLLAAIGSVVVSALTAPSLATVSAGAVVNAPPGGRITVEVQTVNGSGCPNGTTAVAVAPDNTAFTVTYSQYSAQVGVGASPTDFRKNCQLSLLVHVPQGFTYAIAKADYRGFASLAAGATGLQQASYYFMGQSGNRAVQHTFAGPLEDNWQTTDIAEVAELVFAPCGMDRNLNLNTELRVGLGTSNPYTTTSFLTMDSTDGSLRTIYHFAWKPC